MASQFVGVDGCKAGWFSVGLDRDGFETEVFCTFSVPAGPLPPCQAHSRRYPDWAPREQRRARLRPRGPGEAGQATRASSVFPTPTRQTVQQASRAPCDYEAAAVREREVAGKGTSKQSFAIAPKIAEVDEVIRARGPGAEPVVREVHPELLFCTLNRAKPMESPKKRKQGRDERLCVLRREEPRTQEIYDKTRARFRRNVVANDDIVDALAAAVVAHHHHGQLRTLPECPPKDAKGLRMEIVYPG